MTTISISIQARASAFRQTLFETIPPKNQSDRTAFRNVANWLRDEIEAGRRTDESFVYALDLAHEACEHGIRNPAAAFMSLLKKEMGYKTGVRTNAG